MSAPRRKPAVVHEIGAETVLCKVEGGRLLVLNEVGGAVWHLIDGHRSVEEIAALVVESLPADPVRVRRDVTAFLDALAEHDLVEWTE
ncbi:MAG: PqqD family protein [Sandaracinaceae bacterium]|nr:PqqD family protein [Sandaracinaceae bacterium]